MPNAFSKYFKGKIFTNLVKSTQCLMLLVNISRVKFSRMAIDS